MTCGWLKMEDDKLAKPWVEPYLTGRDRVLTG